MPAIDQQAAAQSRDNVSRILIVEDDPTIEHALSDLLEDRYELFLASAGQDALNLLRRHKDTDLVLLDYQLPDMSGVEVLRTIKMIKPSVPVIFITGYGSEDVAIKAFTSGARDYVKKPFSYSDLEKKIEFCLSLKSFSPAARRTAISPPSATAAFAAGHSNKSNFYKIQRAVKYMEENFTAKVCLETAAGKAFISKYHFSRVFSEIMGISFKKYLVNLKMEKAKELLRRGDLTIAETADAIGYEEAAYFVKIFKQHTGCTPSSYRKRYVLCPRPMP